MNRESERGNNVYYESMKRKLGLQGRWKKNLTNPANKTKCLHFYTSSRGRETEGGDWCIHTQRQRIQGAERTNCRGDIWWCWAALKWTAANFLNTAKMAQNGDQSDVEAIPTELSVKHPLQNAWVLWFDNPVKRLGEKDWKNNLKKVCRLFSLL